MGLKLKVEKLEDVEEAHRGLYSAADGGGFQLGVDDLEDTGALKRAKDYEVEARKKAEADLKKLQDERKAADEKARKAAEEAARSAGNVEALEKSWKEKLANDLAAKDSEYQPKVQKLDATVRRLLVSDVATRLASELALKGSEGPLAKLISDRLAVEERDGEHVTVVRDANGKPSAATVDDLKKEILGDKALAPLLAGTKASGGGAGGGKGGGAAGAKSVTRSVFNAMNPAEQMAHMRGTNGVKGTVTDD